MYFVFYVAAQAARAALPQWRGGERPRLFSVVLHCTVLCRHADSETLPCT